MATKKSKSPPPTAPPDPLNWRLVEPKDGKPYWRRKRGTVKKAKLNEAFKKNVRLTKLASPAATEIRKKLLPFLENIDTGRFVAKVSGRLRKMYKEKGRLDLQAMNGYEMQPYRPFGKLTTAKCFSSVKGNEITTEITFFEAPRDRRNTLIDGFYFELILLYGDLEKPGTLRVDSEKSPMYDMNVKKNTTCKIALYLPSRKTSWVLFLKLSCWEKDRPAINSRHHGMKVIQTGSTG